MNWFGVNYTPFHSFRTAAAGSGGLGLEVGDDGFEGLDGLVYVSVGVGEGGVEFLGALEDSVLLDEVAEAGL